MSVRTVSTFTLAAALLLGAVRSAAAQEGGFQTPLNAAPVPRMAPPTPPGGVQIAVPPLGPLALDLSFPLPSEPVSDQRQVFNFVTGLLGSGPHECLPPTPVPACPAGLSGGFGSYCAPALPRLVPPSRVPERVFMSAPAGTHLILFEDTPACPVERTGGPALDGYHILRRSRLAPGGTPMSRDMTGGMGSYCAPELPRLVTPVQSPQPRLLVSGPGSIQLIGVEDVLTAPTCPPCPLPKVTPNPLLGTWHRTVPGFDATVVVTFTHDELKLCVTHFADGLTVTVTATAHYTLTPDGLVYGAITSTDVGTKSDPKAEEAKNEEGAELALIAQSLVDGPFSFRTKMTSAGLMVSGVRCGAPIDSDAAVQSQIAFGGLFKPAKDGKVPALAPLKTKTSKAPEPVLGAVAGAAIGRPACGAALGGLTGQMPTPVPPGCVIERVGVDFNTPPMMVPPPAPPVVCSPPVVNAGPPILSDVPYLNRLYKNVGVAPAPLPQPRPVGPGVSEDSTKQMAQEAFGQLLQQSGVTRSAGGMTLPSGRYLEHYPQYFAPDQVLPTPQELCGQGTSSVRPTGATVAAPAVKGTVGTWYRDVAGKLCVVKVTPDHLTLTVHDAQEVDGKVSTASLVITADYHLTRDGVTAVGLVTSVDVSFEGDFPAEDSKPFFDMLSELQKVLEDKPFALTFRTYGDALVIGNVRMPQVSDRMDVQPAGYMGGRYKAAGDKPPKPKPVKVSLDRPVLAERGVAVPNGLTPGPALGAPGPNLPPGVAYPESAPPPPLPSSPPSGDLLPPQRIPPAQSPRVVPSGVWAPPATEPQKPVPQMPQPIPPG